MGKSLAGAATRADARPVAHAVRQPFDHSRVWVDCTNSSRRFVEVFVRLVWGRSRSLTLAHQLELQCVAHFSI